MIITEKNDVSDKADMDNKKETSTDNKDTVVPYTGESSSVSVMRLYL